MSEIKFLRGKTEQPEFRIKKEEGKLPKIEGYAAIFNSKTEIGWFTESIAPGAFAESIARPDDVRALFNHDANQVLGRTKAGTLELREDEKGLFCVITPPETQLGRDLVVSIERGDISQMSFGFYLEVEESQAEKDKKPHFVIKKARLFDISPVTFPAYEATEVGISRGYRSRDMTNSGNPEAELEQRKREVDLIILESGLGFEN